MARNPIDELKETALWQYLFSIDKDYANRCIIFVENVFPILGSVVKYFPYYTNHDANHSYNIIDRMAQILNPDCLIKESAIAFSKTEVFLLICSAYGHDLGMAILPGEENQLSSGYKISKGDGWETAPELQAELRLTHSERGGHYVHQMNEKIGIPINLTTQLHLLMKAHNLSTSELYSVVGRRFAGESKEIDLLQLASILCIGDLLEYSDTRVKDGVINQIQENIKNHDDEALIISLRENLKHLCIYDGLAIGPDGKIIISGSFEDPDILNLAYKTVDVIEKWVRDYNEIDYQSPKKRLRIRSDSVYTTLEMVGKDFERLGIRMNKQNVIGLISSNSVWNNREEYVIRELLQNSVEACRYRKHNTPLSANYVPRITVSFNKEDRSIVIEDNGCGMTRNVILNNFLTVGNSRSIEPDYASSGYQSLARFGIGFWSVFTIADSADIITAPYMPENNGRQTEALSFQVSINSLKDYIIFDSKKKSDAGTRIELHIKDKKNLNNMFNKLTGPYGIIQCCEISTTIKMGNQIIELQYDILPPERDELLGATISQANKEEIQIFNYYKLTQDYKIAIFIVYRKTEAGLTFWLSSGKSVDSLTRLIHGFEVSCICGFNSTVHTKPMLNDIIGGHIVGYISNTHNPEGFEYGLNRSHLLHSNRYNEYSTFITSSIIDAYRSLLKAHDSNDPKSIFRLFNESSRWLTKGEGSDTTNRLKMILEQAPDLLAYELHKIDYGKTLDSCITEYIDIKNLLKKDYTIVTFEAFSNIHVRRILDKRIHKPILYDIIKSLSMPQDNLYYSYRGNADLLFDNDPNSYVIFIRNKIADYDYTFFTFLISNTHSISVESGKESYLGRIQNTFWSGAIYIKRIVDCNFAFANQIFFIQPNTLLAIDIISLYEMGEENKIGKIINLISLAIIGHVDKAIEKYL